MAEPFKNPAALKLPMSLYPELLQSERATISAAPVRYDAQQKPGDEDAQQLQQKKKKDASLQFQPLKRPQQAQQKKKQQPKTGFSSSSSLHKFSSSVNTAPASSPPKSLAGSTPSVQRSTFQDWVADEDDEFYYQDRPRAQRGGKNRKKKNKTQEVRTWDWDDIYDPTRPNVFADYKGSEEQHREIRDWKARLYHRQLKEAKRANMARSDDESSGTRPANKMFAPPSQQMSFAPPTFDDRSPPPPLDDDDDDFYPPSNGHRDSNPSVLPAQTPPPPVPDHATGEDAYLRRMRMSGAAQDHSPPVFSPAQAPSIPTPPPAFSPAASPQIPSKSQEALKAEALAKIAAFKAKYMEAQKPAAAPAATDVNTAVSAAATTPAAPSDRVEASPPPPPPPPQEPGVFISRAPVRYNVQPSTSDPNDGDIPMQSGVGEDVNDQLEVKEPQANRSSKKGFGERLLKKYGWEKGQGLGAQGEGITTALVGKADKRKKRSDADGGGWAAPANMGKIVGGKRRKVESEAEADETHTTNLSFVIKLEGMLAGLDVQKEIEDNNLMQEIGDEMGNNYGNVERVFIWREEQGGGNEVFVKFTSQLSALRAKDAMDGTTFADNEVQAGFWDEEMFERGEYRT